MQPLWKQWTQWTLFRSVCGHNGHNGRCDTLWTLLPLNGVQEVGGSNPLAPTSYPLVALISQYKSTAVHEKEIYYEPDGSSIGLPGAIFVAINDTLHITIVIKRLAHAM